MKISVIIPAYNCAKYIRQTLDCIRTQTFPQKDIETIIFLDGCTDNTPGEVMQYATDYPEMNLRAIKADENQGLANARNSATLIARGEYLHFLDAGDVINTEFYKNLYDAARRVDADVAVASYFFEPYPADSVAFEHETVLGLHQDKIDATRIDRHGKAGCNLVRREFWNRNRFAFPTDMKYCEDMLIMTKTVYHSNRIVLVPGALYTCKCHQNSMHTIRRVRKLHDRDYRRARIDTYLFLCQFEVRRSRSVEYKSWYKVFGFLPMVSMAHSMDGMRRKYHLFGFIPLLTIRCRRIQKQWRI